MRALLIAFFFPPAGGGGVQRPLKLSEHLPQLGIETHVLAPDDPKWIHRDPGRTVPEAAIVHRAHYLGPRGRRPAEELYGTEGLERLARKLTLTPRRFLVPDLFMPWALTAIPAARKLVRQEGIDVVITTSPPDSIHLIGAAVKQATGVRWVADLRDSLVAHPYTRTERRLVRMKGRVQAQVGRLVASRADAVVGVTGTIAEEMRSLNTALRVVAIPNGADFDDFAGLAYRPDGRLRITHTGSFFAGRDPRPFLRALAEADESVVARFVGDFRATDRAWAAGLDLGDRLEVQAYLPHRVSLSLQRDSEALLLLLPDTGARSQDVPSAKLFEYLAAGRPILAAVPPDGAAAQLVDEAGAGIVVAPDDPAAIRSALDELVSRWRAGTLEIPALEPALRARIDRFARSAEFASLLREVTSPAGASGTRIDGRPRR